MSVTHLIILACAVLGALGETEDELQQRSNAFIDTLVERGTNGSTGQLLDPLALEDIETTFEREVLFLKVKGEAKIFDGKLLGLSTMKRVGDAMVVDLDDILLLTAELEFEKLTASLKALVQVNGVGPNVTLDAKIGKSNVIMSIMAPSVGGKADLMSFDVKFENARVSIQGLGPLSWAASILTSTVANALQKPVSKFVSVKMFEHFSKELEEVPFPGKN